MKTIVKITAAIILMSVSQMATANLISLFETQRDTDVAYAGVGGLRGNGFGDITLAGTSGTINQAYLYWHGPTQSADPDFNANIMFDGNAISGTNIGTSADNNWGQLNSQAYRADVTALVSGDGTYSLSGLSPNNSNGASLVVYYDDGVAANNRDVVTFDGNDSNIDNAFDPIGWDVTLAGINYSGGPASLVMGVSDGQSFNDGNFLLNGLPLLSGNVFDGLTVPQTPNSSVGNGGLWDILEVDITAFLSMGMNTINLTHSAGGDALSGVHFHVNLPAGAAPGGDPIPEPIGIILLGTGLLVMRLSATRK